MAAPKSETYERLNRQWNGACKAVLGEETGDLRSFSGWLLDGLEPYLKKSSSVSKKEVLAIGNYAPHSRFISFDEINYAKKFEPLALDEVKDIDSLIGAVRERAVYAGNIILGNSSHSESSSGLEDSNFVLESHTMHSCQEVAYSTLCRESRSIFGCGLIGESGFSIKSFNHWRSQRCLETNLVYNSADIHYSHRLDGCAQCFFCFGLKGKRYMIGNAQLAPDAYLALKSKLLSELADELKRKKRLPRLHEIYSVPPAKKIAVKIDAKEEKGDMAPINESFASTSKLIFGKEAGSLAALEAWLSRNVRAVHKVKSVLSGRELYHSSAVFQKQMEGTGRLVKLAEIDVIGMLQRKLPKNLPESFRKLAEWADEIAYFSAEEDVQSKNCVECASVYNASDAYRSSHAYFCKCVADCYWPRNSEYLFGCDSVRNSSFCIKCYNSYKITRCFEADTCQNCTGCYFVHNCENVHDSMFCFNVKNLRYAVGNAEVGRGEFMRLKGILLSAITSSLGKKKDFPASIYDMGKK